MAWNTYFYLPRELLNYLSDNLIVSIFQITTLVAQ